MVEIDWNQARLELKDAPEGTYVFIYKDEKSTFPEYDYLQDSRDLAIQFCLEDLKAPQSAIKKFT